MKSTLLLTLLVLLWMPVLNYGQARAFRDFIVAASSPSDHYDQGAIYCYLLRAQLDLERIGALLGLQAKWSGTY